MGTSESDFLCSQSTGPSPHKTTFFNGTKMKGMEVASSPFVGKYKPRKSLLLVLKHMFRILYLLIRLNPIMTLSVSKCNVFKLTTR